jgi:hypothetical protein
LAGNFPYWKRDEVATHPDEMLRARLTYMYMDDETSLIEQDLYALAQGLEGRTTNPVSLLVSLTYVAESLLAFVCMLYINRLRRRVVYDFDVTLT